MNFAGRILPDEDMLLADAEHMLDISRLYDVATLEGYALEAVIHFGDIVA